MQYRDNEQLNINTEQDISWLGGKFVGISPSSREDMKQQIHELLEAPDTLLIDTHNTKSMIFVFTHEGERLGLKVEYGEAKVTRDEAHWYEKTPDRLKKHYRMSTVEDMHAFVLLQWFDGAPTIEQLAINSPDSHDAVDAYLDALSQDEELFTTYPSVPLTSTDQHGFFYDKFFAKLSQAKASPYLHEFLTQESVEVNGRKLPGAEKLIRYIQSDDRLREYISPTKAGFIHGDLHADNLIVDSGNVYMVDPNGIDYLPLEYDHGRVVWSFTGWNAIVRHEHQLEVVDDAYELSVPVREQYKTGVDSIKNYFRDYSAKFGLLPDQGYHRALYSSAMQYLSRADHAGVEHEALALHLQGLIQLSDLFEELGGTLEDVINSPLIKE